MKRISLAYALLLLVSLALAAADAPALAPLPILETANSCTLGSLESAPLVKEPQLKTYLQPPCIATADCPDGSTISCPVSYNTGCMSQDGCWAICEDGPILYCPGTVGKPGCEVY